MTMTESKVTAILAEKYSGQAWAFIPQVPNGTGLSKSRTCDAIAMSLWPSNGLHIHGFEIKVNRSDWLNEIQDLSKSFAFSQYCHYWWVVAPKGVVKIEEMPENWGLKQITTSDSVRVKKAASFNHSRSEVELELLAGLLRASMKASPAKEVIDEAFNRGFQEGRKREKEFLNHQAKAASESLRRLQATVKGFEEATGLQIDRYGGAADLGRRVKALESIENIERELKRTAETARRLGEAAENLRAELFDSRDA